jgi:ribosomal protein S18 acetylase RimI-like enzyme
MIKIIQANREHSQIIAEIGKQAFWESHGHSASQEDIDSFIAKTYNKEAINKEFGNPKVHYLLIQCQDKIAGFSKIEWSISNQNINDLNITKLDRLYLLKEYYGKDLGAKLLHATIEISKQNHQDGIWLAVWKENPKAIRFYTKTGFKIVGEFNFKISEAHSNPNHIMYLKY